MNSISPKRKKEERNYGWIHRNEENIIYTKRKGAYFIGNFITTTDLRVPPKTESLLVRVFKTFFFHKQLAMRLTTNSYLTECFLETNLPNKPKNNNIQIFCEPIVSFFMFSISVSLILKFTECFSSYVF